MKLRKHNYAQEDNSKPFPIGARIRSVRRNYDRNYSKYLVTGYVRCPDGRYCDCPTNNTKMVVVRLGSDDRPMYTGSGNSDPMCMARNDYNHQPIWKFVRIKVRGSKVLKGVVSK